MNIIESIKKVFIFIIIILVTFFSGYSQRSGIFESIVRGISRVDVANVTKRYDDFLNITLRASSSFHPKNNFSYIGIEDGKIFSKCLYLDKNGEIIELSHNFSEFSVFDESIFKEYEIYIEPDVYFTSEFQQFENKLEHVNIILGENIHRKLFIKDQIIEVQPSLHYKLQNRIELQNIMALYTWPLKKSDFKIVSVLDEKIDRDAIIELEKITSRNMIDYRVLSRDNLEDIFEESADKFLIITGHYDGEKFFAKQFRDDKTSLQSFSSTELINLGKKHNVYTFFLGCETSKIRYGAGYLEKIYEHEILNQLKIALNQTSFIDFIASFGTPSNQLMIERTLIEKGRSIYTINSKDKTADVAMILAISNVPLGSPRGIKLFIETMTEYLFNTIVIIILIAFFFRKAKFLWYILYSLVLYGVIWLICQIINLF